MAGALCIVIGVLTALGGVALVVNAYGVGERVATFGGSITFMFDGGQTLKRRQHAYRTWGAVLIAGGVLAVAIGIAALS